MIVKRDGAVESFDRSKLLRGLVRACEKTGICQSRLEAVIDEIESQLQLRSLHEVSSTEVGEMVLTHLKRINEVAYVRFASVYRQFRGVKDFAEALRQLDRSAEIP
jgi:transcriptional repressor NrdR